MIVFRKTGLGWRMLTVLSFYFLFCFTLSYGYENFPVKGMVTMIDFGAKTCIPCKMMTPILEKLEKAYQGKAAVIFIDIRKERDKIQKYGIRAIPTQIFFDEEGREVHRHVGFMSEEAIVAQLKNMGVK